MEEVTKSSGAAEKIILDDVTKGKWYKVVFSLKKQFGKKPNMDAIIYLIGVNEFGHMREFAKDEKMDLMHIATCKLLSYEGYFVYDGKDEEGWPHYTMLKKPPYTDLLSQENLLRKLVVQYYEENNLFEEN
ncbi:MAG: hypothetical protein Q8M15_06640 [Bacteroidota bacterium]|nr:hypothetical protein [Bacteroidota bacterium]